MEYRGCQPEPISGEPEDIGFQAVTVATHNILAFPLIVTLWVKGRSDVRKRH